ncbi:MAG: LPS export ABC transporter ATP-binding protein [Crocinitomicaceae bacterium]|nr:LPS export ABC transporter ATP-binding protein [Crocinitomicaceae bacterium]
MKLRTDNIHKVYKGRKVVNGVSVEVNQGEIVGLLGPNGAGKTTSFYMIVGLISPNEGHVYLDDLDITHYPMFKRAQLGIGYLPQEVSVFRKMSVEDNVMAVLEMTKLTKEERKARLEVLLDEFGLQHVRKNLGQSLSGGEKRRTEIARALATDPKFILLDEPFAGVDPIAVEDIQRIVWKLKSKNIGVLITDHNVQETLSITDRTYLLFEGGILRSGTAEQLAEDPQVRKVYLGHNFELRRTDFSESQAERDIRENELKTDDERNAGYIGNILNLANKAKYILDQKSSFRYHDDLLESTNIDEVIYRE